MAAQDMARVRERVALAYRRVRHYASGVPGKAWAVLGLFLFSAVLMALHTALTAKDASLHLKLQHEFRNASVSVWVDDDLVYSGEITGSTKKKFGLIPTDSAQGNLSQIIPVRSGQHSIRLRVEPDAATMQEDSIRGNFPDHIARNLAVSARHSGLSLSWQGQDSAPVVKSSSAVGWLSEYAGSLILTITGSIMSALAGYAIKELPARLRSTTDSPSKAESPSSAGLSVE
jgi:hypothetical protein